MLPYLSHMGAISSAKIFNFRIEKGKTLNSSKHLAINLLLVPLTMKYVKVWFLKKYYSIHRRATRIYEWIDKSLKNDLLFLKKLSVAFIRISMRQVKSPIFALTTIVVFTHNFYKTISLHTYSRTSLRKLSFYEQKHKVANYYWKCKQKKKILPL